MTEPKSYTIVIKSDDKVSVGNLSPGLKFVRFICERFYVGDRVYKVRYDLHYTDTGVRVSCGSMDLAEKDPGLSYRQQWDKKDDMERLVLSSVDEWIASHPNEMLQSKIDGWTSIGEQLDLRVEAKRSEMMELIEESAEAYEKAHEFKALLKQLPIKFVQMHECRGEAHFNPHIDNCGICAPMWGEIPFCSCGSPRPMRITPHYFICREFSCKSRIKRIDAARIKQPTKGYARCGNDRCKHIVEIEYGTFDAFICPRCHTETEVPGRMKAPEL